MSDWKPIETAPKDSNLIVAHDEEVCEAYYDGESDAWFKANKSEHDFDFVRSDRVYPTHWQPLPKPPMARASTELAQIDVDGGEYIPEHHRQAGEG